MQKSVSPALVACPYCSQPFRKNGMAGHIKWKHTGKDVPPIESLAVVEAAERVRYVERPSAPDEDLDEDIDAADAASVDAADSLPVPFRAAVKKTITAAGFNEEKKEPGDKEDSFLFSILKGLAWLGGAYVVFLLAISGKAPGGSPKLPGPKGVGNWNRF